MDWVGFIFGFGCLQGLILAAVLLFRRGEKRLSHQFMAALVFLISAHLAYLWAGRAGVFADHPLIGIGLNALKYVWGPLLFLYAYSLTNQKLSHWHWLHSIPFLFLTLPVTQVALMEPELQSVFIEFIRTRSTDNIEPHLLAQFPRFWVEFLSNFMHGNLFALQFGSYCFLVLKQIRQHTKVLQQHYSYLEKMDLSWLRILTAVCLLFLLTYVLLNRPSIMAASEFNSRSILASLPFVFLVIGVYVMGFMALYQPDLLGLIKVAEQPGNTQENEPISLEGDIEEDGHGDNKPLSKPNNVKSEPVKNQHSTTVDKGATGAESQTEAQNGQKTTPKYRRSTIPPEEVKDYIARLMRAMEEEELYLDSELTMPDLAKQAGLAPYQVSQILNGPMNQSFFAFVNYYRIELAKQMMASPETEKMAIVDLAMEVGFKSKSSFYDAFKRSTQMTPTQYKKSIKQAP